VPTAGERLHACDISRAGVHETYEDRRLESVCLCQGSRSLHSNLVPERSQSWSCRHRPNLMAGAANSPNAVAVYGFVDQNKHAGSRLAATAMQIIVPAAYHLPGIPSNGNHPCLFLFRSVSREFYRQRGAEAQEGFAN
jgi:hypothetical protein